jgi:dephospho-CoA kinase
MLKIGLTGGIGSGKSTIANVFRHLGIPIFESDKEAKKAYLDSQILKKIHSRWGHRVFDHDQIDLTLIGKIVFAQPSELKWLESLIHPFVQMQWKSFENQHTHCKYIIKESALLFQTNGHEDCDGVIGVLADSSIKIQRVKTRSGLTEEQIKTRMKNQLTDADIAPQCQWIIHNNGMEALIPQIVNIHFDITHDTSF